MAALKRDHSRDNLTLTLVRSIQSETILRFGDFGIRTREFERYTRAQLLDLGTNARKV